MRTLSRGALAVAALLIGSASATAGDGVVYQLGDSANYTDTCGPVGILAPLNGTFEMTQISSSFALQEYLITDVDWTIGGLGGQLTPVTGFGRYEIQGDFTLTHRMRLELSIDGGPLVPYDSGFLIGGFGFPFIDIAISRLLPPCATGNQTFDIRAGVLALGKNYCDNTPNTTGNQAKIDVFGNPVVAANDLMLSCVDMPPFSNGIFFFGAQQTEVPFGEGVLCVQPPLKRIQPVMNSGPNGMLLRSVDLTSQGIDQLILPGTSWNFQCWFRDSNGGPAGFNTSNGYCASFF